MTRGHLLLAGFLCIATATHAEEKQGIRLDVAPHMTENKSERKQTTSNHAEVDKTMAMKVAV